MCVYDAYIYIYIYILGGKSPALNVMAIPNAALFFLWQWPGYWGPVLPVPPVLPLCTATTTTTSNNDNNDNHNNDSNDNNHSNDGLYMLF